MEIPDLSDENQRDRFVKEFRDAVDEKRYPECDASLVYDLLVGLFTVDKARESEFDDFASEIESIIEEVVEPLETYTEAQERDDGERDLSGEEVAAAMCVHPWYEAMSSLVTVNGETLKCGDLVNRSMRTDDVEVAIDGFETVENDIRKHLTGESVGDVPEDSPYKKTEEEIKSSMDEVFVYFVLMMSFHRVLNNSRISESAMRAP